MTEKQNEEQQHEKEEETSSSNIPQVLQVIQRKKDFRLTIQCIANAIIMVARFMMRIYEKRWNESGGTAPWYADEKTYFGLYGQQQRKILRAKERKKRSYNHNNDDISGDNNNIEDQEEARTDQQQQQQEISEQNIDDEKSLAAYRQRRFGGNAASRKQQQKKLEEIQKNCCFDELPSSNVELSLYETVDEQQEQNNNNNNSSQRNFGFSSSSASATTTTGNRSIVHTISSNPNDIVEVAMTSVIECAHTLQEIPQEEDFEEFPPEVVKNIFAGVGEAHHFIADLLRYRVWRRRRLKEEQVGFGNLVDSAHSTIAAKSPVKKVSGVSNVKVTASQASTLPTREAAMEKILEAAKNSIVFKDWCPGIFTHVAEHSPLWSNLGSVDKPGAIRRFQPGETIIYRGEEDDRVAWFLIEGCVWELEQTSTKSKRVGLGINSRPKALHGVPDSFLQETLQSISSSSSSQSNSGSKLNSKNLGKVQSHNNSNENDQNNNNNKEDDRESVATSATTKTNATSSKLSKQQSFALSAVGGGDNANLSSFLSSSNAAGVGSGAGTSSSSSSHHHHSSKTASILSSMEDSAFQTATRVFSTDKLTIPTRPVCLRDGNVILHIPNRRAFVAASQCIVCMLPVEELENSFCGEGSLNGADENANSNKFWIPSTAAEWSQLAKSRQRLLSERAGRIRAMTANLLRRSPLLASLQNSQADSIVGFCKSCCFLKNSTMIPRRFDQESGEALELDGCCVAESSSSPTTNTNANANNNSAEMISKQKSRCQRIFCSDISCLPILRESICYMIRGDAAASSQRRSGSTWFRVNFFKFQQGSTLGEMSCYFRQENVFDVVANTMCDVIFLPRPALMRAAQFDLACRNAISDGALALRQSSSVSRLTIRTLRKVQWIRRCIDIGLLTDAHCFDAINEFKLTVFNPGEMIGSTSSEVEKIFVIANGTAVRSNIPSNMKNRYVNHWELIGSEAAVFPAMRWNRPIVALTVVEAWTISPKSLTFAFCSIPKALRVVADDGVTIIASRPTKLQQIQLAKTKIAGGVGGATTNVSASFASKNTGSGGDNKFKKHRKKKEIDVEQVEEQEEEDDEENLEERDGKESRKIKLLKLRDVATFMLELQDEVVRCVPRVKHNQQQQQQQQQQSSPTTIKKNKKRPDPKLSSSLATKEQAKRIPAFGVPPAPPPDVNINSTSEENINSQKTTTKNLDPEAKKRLDKNWKEIEKISSKNYRTQQEEEKFQKMEQMLYSPPKIPVRTNCRFGIRENPQERGYEYLSNNGDDGEENEFGSSGYFSSTSHSVSPHSVVPHQEEKVEEVAAKEKIEPQKQESKVEEQEKQQEEKEEEDFKTPEKQKIHDNQNDDDKNNISETNNSLKEIERGGDMSGVSIAISPSPEVKFHQHQQHHRYPTTNYRSKLVSSSPSPSHSTRQQQKLSMSDLMKMITSSHPQLHQQQQQQQNIQQQEKIYSSTPSPSQTKKFSHHQHQQQQQNAPAATPSPVHHFSGSPARNLIHLSPHQKLKKQMQQDPNEEFTYANTQQHQQNQEQQQQQQEEAAVVDPLLDQLQHRYFDHKPTADPWIVGNLASKRRRMNQHQQAQSGLSRRFHESPLENCGSLVMRARLLLQNTGEQQINDNEGEREEE